MANLPLLVDKDGNIEPLHMFSVGDIKRKYGLDTVRSAFGVGFTEFGDRRPDPLTVTLKGPIYGATPQEYQESKNKYYRLLNRRGQLLRNNGLQIPLGGIVNDTQGFEDVMGKVDMWEWELNVLSAYWEAAAPTEVLLPDLKGNTAATGEYEIPVVGTARTYPTLTFDTTGLSAFEVFVNGRSLSWTYFSGGQRAFLSGSSIELDYYKGTVYRITNGVMTDIRNELRTDSQFSSFLASTDTGPTNNYVRLKIAGESPVTAANIKITFKERYY